MADPVKHAPPLPGELLRELLPIVAELNAILDPERLLPSIAEKIRRIVTFRNLDIFVPAPDGTLVPAHIEGDSEEVAAARRLRLRLGEGIVGRAAELREPVFVADVTTDPGYVEAFPGVLAELAIPLIHRERLVGVLNIEGPDVDAFTSEARAALQLIASHLAVAIANATLHRETQRYAGMLALLYDVGKEIASILDLDQLLHRIAAVVKRVIDYEMFAILLLDERTSELVLRKAVRFGIRGEKTRLKVGEGLCGYAAQHREPVLVGDVRRDPRYVELVPETRSELVVPLIHKDRLVGVFDLESTVLNRFDEENVKILTPLASQVAIAIENARLYDELRRKEERLDKQLAIAREVQNGLFPEECPSGPGWEASAHFRPAQELGGDLYDFYDLGSGRIGLAAGDVSGKGVPAALFAAFTSGVVRARAFERRTPVELMGRANRTLFRRGLEGFFCTLVYALFDFPARELRVVNAGLPYPLHFRAETARCGPLEVAGLPLGAFESAAYDEIMVPLAPGDVVVVATDGITEAYSGREEYGTMRLRSLIERHSALKAPQLGERILTDVDQFLSGAVPEDDLTLVVVKVL